MLRAQHMAALSQRLALLIRSLTLSEDVTLAVDIDPVDLAWRKIVAANVSWR